MSVGKVFDKVWRLISPPPDYIRYYYQYNPQRLSTCLLTIYALLHIADGIKAIGPVWTYWAFPMEQFCGRVQQSIKTRRFPFASIDTLIVADARLKQLGFQWNISQMLSLKPPLNNADRQDYEISIPGCEYYHHDLLQASDTSSFQTIAVFLRRRILKRAIQQISN